MAPFKWAPLDVPFARRAQTAAVLFILCIPLILLVATTLALATSAWARFILLVLYPCWMAWDWRTPWRGGRPSQWFRNTPVAKAARDFFPSQLVVTKALPLAPPSLICVHPHGVISAGVLMSLLLNNAAHTASHRIGDYRIATVKINMVLPLWRELILLCGFVDASRAAISYCLTHGLSVVVVVGGAVESLDAYPGSTELTLTKRAWRCRDSEYSVDDSSYY